MFKKVLILSDSAGAVHVRAALAIERALIEMNAAGQVRHIDALNTRQNFFGKIKFYVVEKI